MLRYLLLCLVLALPACSFMNPADPASRDSSRMLAELNRERTRWERQKPPAYEYIYQRSCFCVAESVQPIRISVQDGRLRSAVSVTTGRAVDREHLFMAEIAQLFDFVENAIREGAHRVVVQYDRERGHPVMVSIDFSQYTADDEVTIAIRDLVPR